ncbi:MAG TPA: hypothetical protein VKR56_10450 [Candidatus Cybelea sp.]|nr:hypothetical protein [Candidatus Cybelea sp.]
MQPVIGASGTMPQTGATVSLAAKGSGNLFVDDYENNAVEIVTNGGAAPSLEGQLEAPGWNKIGTIMEDLSNQPASNWVDKHGNLYVPDYNFTAVGLTLPQVTEYDPSGTLKFVYSSNMEFPHAVTTDARGDVFEADAFNGVNEYYQGSNAVVATCPQLGGGQRGVAVDTKGDVFASYSTSDSTGAIVEYTGGLTGCPETVLEVSLGVPGGLVLDKSANLVVCDETNGVVDIIDPPYSQISAHLGRDYGPYRFEMPVSVSINKNNTLAYVTDWAEQNVDVVTYPAGAAFAQVGSGSGVSYPAGAVDESNYVP